MSRFNVGSWLRGFVRKWHHTTQTIRSKSAPPYGLRARRVVPQLEGLEELALPNTFCDPLAEAAAVAVVGSLATPGAQVVIDFAPCAVRGATASEAITEPGATPTAAPETAARAEDGQTENTPATEPKPDDHSHTISPDEQDRPLDATWLLTAFHEDLFEDPFPTEETASSSAAVESLDVSDSQPAGSGASDGHSPSGVPGNHAVASGAGNAPSDSSAAGIDFGLLTGLPGTGAPSGATASAPEQGPSEEQVAEQYGRLGRRFELNVGQFADAQVQFVSRGAGTDFLLSATHADVLLKQPTADSAAEEPASASSVLPIRMEIVGANPAAAPTAVGQLETRTNYLIGNDPDDWFTDVPNFQGVRYDEVYEGIDVFYYGTADGQLEYDFIVAPGADVGQIELNFHGVDGVSLGRGGELIISTAAGEVIQHSPMLYQDIGGVRQAVSGSFVLQGGNRIGFGVGAYNPSQPLTIDPVWEYSSYLGGSRVDEAYAIALGNENGTFPAYVAGTTESWDGFRPNEVPGNPFPPTTRLPGTAQNTNTYDVFVGKLNPQGTALSYLTYLIGSGNDEAHDIVVDGSGAAYITGSTVSNNFPRVNAWQNNYGGAGDAFVSKLSPAGNALVFSTYVGGAQEDIGNSIALDSNLDIYVAGTTSSANFNGQNPTAFGPAGGSDAFMAKFTNPAGALDYLVYVRGNADDTARGVAVDQAGDVYLTGHTDSANFHAPAGNFQTAPRDGQDAFLTKLRRPAGQAPQVVYSTYFGGTAEDTGANLIVSPTDGSVYVVGSSRSTPNQGFGPAMNPLAPTHTLGGPTADAANAFVIKFDANGNPRNNPYLTFLGGDRTDVARDIVRTGAGTLYIVGETYSPPGAQDFPITPATLQGIRRGASDAFVALLDPAQAGNASLVFSTYIGGPGRDYSNGITVDPAGNAYVAGATWSDFFRPAPGNNPPIPAFQYRYGGGGFDGFMVKINPTAQPANRRAQLDPVGNQAVTVGDSLTLLVTGSDPDGDPVSFSLEGAPSGVVFDPAGGLFSWTPSPGQGPASYTFLVQATDDGGRFDEQALTVIVAASSGQTDLAGDTLATALPAYSYTGLKAEIAGTVGDGSYGSADVDLYRLDLLAGQELTADIDALTLDSGGSLSGLDSYLRLFDASGTELAFNNDANDPDTGVFSADAALTYIVPLDGVYYVGVSGSPNVGYNPMAAGSGSSGNTGDYRLQLTFS